MGNLLVHRLIVRSVVQITGISTYISYFILHLHTICPCKCSILILRKYHRSKCIAINSSQPGWCCKFRRTFLNCDRYFNRNVFIFALTVIPIIVFSILRGKYCGICLFPVTRGSYRCIRILPCISSGIPSRFQ